MDNVKIFADKHQLAEAVAHDTIHQLAHVIAKQGQASWVLAGGTTPEAAYKIIAQRYLESLDWSRVTVLIGDERIAPLTSPDSNWHAAEHALLHAIPAATFLRPITNQSAEQAAKEYEQQLSQLPRTAAGFPQLDIVWLGMGEDGHTLSLFPHHPDFQPTNRFVIPVRNSPKPPPDRISFSLAALHGADTTFIITAGEGKAQAIRDALTPESTLPIAQAARLTKARWYIDAPAATYIQ